MNNLELHQVEELVKNGGIAQAGFDFPQRRIQYTLSYKDGLYYLNGKRMTDKDRLMLHYHEERQQERWTYMETGR